MIRLTLNPKDFPQSLVFHQPILTIGGKSVSSDFSIGDEEEATLCVKIFEEKGAFYIVNLGNDPLVSLNEMPFRKSMLKPNDKISIGKVVINFEEGIAEEIENQPQQQLREILEDNDAPPPQNSVGGLIQEQTIDLGIKSNDSILHVFAMRLGLILTIALTLIIASSIAATALYISFNAKSVKEKIIAAEGVADVAMALTYAQINHIKPQKQNWFDPDFIKNNLASILSSEYPSFANIDSQGQFLNCPYILRIYTSSDLSQFVVIAQPEPSFFQWLIPKTTIVLDSRAMELRSLSDLKALNRLLVNPSTLDGTNALDISHVVRQGELIALHSLGASKSFLPPKALSLLKPGAENKIYNAPRYYQLGETVLKKAVHLMQNSSNSHEVVRLQQQIHELAQFPNIVLYSSEGLQKAMQAQKALATLAPDHIFLTAFLNLNSKGGITNSYLLLAEGHTTSEHRPEKPIIPDNAASAIAVAEEPSSTKNAAADAHHPLLLRLTALATERQHALKKQSDELISLLQQHTSHGVANFESDFSTLLSDYDRIDVEYQTKIAEQLADLYREYSAMPFGEFSSYVNVAGLQHLVTGSLTFLTEDTELNSQQVEKDIRELLEKIPQTTKFDQLDVLVTQIAESLNLRKLPNPEKLIKYQNELHKKTALQLAEFILQPSSKMESEEFTEINRPIVSHILKAAWITDPDEYNYFLNEFDLRGH